MATYTASCAQSTSPTKGIRVGLEGQFAAYDFTGVSVSIGTVLAMIKIPAGARVLYIQHGTTYTGDCTVEVGDSLAAGKYKSAATLSAGQGMISGMTVPGSYVYSVDDCLQLKISLSSATTLGGIFYMQAIWGLDTGP